MHYSLGRQKHYEIDHVLVGEWDEKFRAFYKHPIVIPAAGHAIHLENPQAVAQILEKRTK
jgi:pimeloyl-ACP methyl ester carboxylesterase